MKVNLPIIYSQWDPRWADLFLGFNTKLPFNIYNYGCLLCCWAMCNRYYQKDTDPGRLNEMFKKMGVGKAFDDGGNYKPGGNNLAYGDVKETRTVTPSLLTDEQINKIKTSLDNGYPVIIGLDYNPKDVDYDSHFVVVVDYNPNEENDFTIADPLGGKVRSLKDYLGWFKPNARNTIESFIVTSGPKPKFSGDMIPVTKAQYDIYLKNDEQWQKLVLYLKPDADPNDTLFEELQTVIAGIKSRQTDLEKQLKVALDQLDQANVEVTNQKDKLANKEAECQRSLKTQKAEYEAIISGMPDVKKLEGQYKGIISELEGKLREAQKAGGIKDLLIARLNKEIEALQKGVEQLSAIKKLLIYLTEQMKRIWGKIIIRIK